MVYLRKSSHHKKKYLSPHPYPFRYSFPLPPPSLSLILPHKSSSSQPTPLAPLLASADGRNARRRRQRRRDLLLAPLLAASADGMITPLLSLAVTTSTSFFSIFASTHRNLGEASSSADAGAAVWRGGVEGQSGSAAGRQSGSAWGGGVGGSSPRRPEGEASGGSRGYGLVLLFFLFDEMFFCRRLNLLHVKMEMSPMKMIFVGLCVQVVLPLTLRKLFLAAYRKTIFLVKARRKRSPWQRSRYAGVAIWRAHASNETGARARLAPLHAFFPLFLCFFLLSPSFSLFFFFFASSSHVFPFFRFPPFF